MSFPRERWLVTGASGLLGCGLLHHLAGETEVIGVFHRHAVTVAGVKSVAVDLTSGAELPAMLAELSPTHIVHAAGLTNVDECERNEALAQTLHAQVAGSLAALARETGAVFATISTDHLWNGRYAMMAEGDPLDPINAYARTKAAGEAATLAANPEGLIIRTNFFGPGLPWRQSFSDWILAELRAGRPVNAFSDVHFTPIALDLLCPLIIRLIRGRANGIWHVAGSERISKFDFARRLASLAGCPLDLVRSGLLATARLAAPRPHDMSLSTAKAAAWFDHDLPSVNESLSTLFANS